MTLYLGNIPYGMTPSDITELLADYGQAANIRIPLRQDTALPRGIALVDLPEVAVRRAIAALNGTTYGGRRLTVEEAHPLRPRRRDAVLNEVRV